MVSEKHNLARLCQSASTTVRYAPDARISKMRWQPVTRILPIALFIDAALVYLGWVIWEMMP